VRRFTSLYKDCSLAPVRGASLRWRHRCLVDRGEIEQCCRSGPSPPVSDNHARDPPTQWAYVKPAGFHVGYVEVEAI